MLQLPGDLLKQRGVCQDFPDKRMFNDLPTARLTEESEFRLDSGTSSEREHLRTNPLFRSSRLECLDEPFRGDRGRRFSADNVLLDAGLHILYVGMLVKTIS
uniref:Uncharacterized protein n=1 Tax=Candidatus Kentrum sp. FW TaxID=2126338 RepID=A0A450U0S6_9GAMM|nr:MAG: hypothetical protein BECKFW1821C_GA0114237_109111 [Candidatus Kentron sp. FW]